MTVVDNPGNLPDQAMKVEININPVNRAMTAFNPQDAEIARPAFEKVRQAINAQSLIRPFVFYHARVYLDDMYGGPEMFASLIELLKNEAVSKHYDLQEDLQKIDIAERERKILVQFIDELESLKKVDLQLLKQAGVMTQENPRVRFQSFLRQYFQNESFSDQKTFDHQTDRFLEYLINFGLWERNLSRLKSTDMNTFFRELSSMGFIPKAHNPMVLAVAELIGILVKKGFLTVEEGQKLSEKWSQLQDKYLILQGIPSLDLDTDLKSGKKFFNPRSKRMLKYIRDGKAGNFVGEYYELTSAIYPLLSKVFFAIAADIKGHDYLPERQGVSELGEGWQVSTLQRGYYRDWNNEWHNVSDKPGQPVNFITFDGTLDKLKDLFKENPAKMIDVFTQAAQQGIFIDELILDAIRQAVQVKIDTEVEWDKNILDQIGNSFVKFMGRKENIAPLLVRMHDIGLFDQILPELTQHKGYFPSGDFHRFSLSYHTLYLLYYFEEGMPQLLQGLKKEDVYERVRNRNSDEIEADRWRLILRFSLFLHDAQKDPEYQPLSSPHPVVGANNLTYQVLERFPRLHFYKNWIAWLVWHHQDLNARAGYAPPETFYHRDLLDIVSNGNDAPSDILQTKNIREKNAYMTMLMDIWYLLTIADAYAVDPHPEEGTNFREPQAHRFLHYQVHDLHTQLVEYYKSDADDKKRIEKDWRNKAKNEDRRDKEGYYRNIVTVGDIRRAFETFRPFISDLTLENLERELSPYQENSISLGQLPPRGYFNNLYDEYTENLLMLYLRQLKGPDMAHEMVMYALMRDSTDPNLILSRAGHINTGLGNLFNLTVNIKKDRPGILYKISGLMTALGLNIVDAKVRTLSLQKPGEAGQQIVVDQMVGYYLPGLVNFEVLWPKLKKLLIEKTGMPSDKMDDIVNDQEGRPAVERAAPVLLKALLIDQITIDDIFKVQETVKGKGFEFQIQQKNLPRETKLSFRKGKGGSVTRLDLVVPDRNGLLYTISRVAEAFGFNIATSPISTGPGGAIDTFLISKDDRSLNPQEIDALKQWYTYFFKLTGYDNDYLIKAVSYIKDGKTPDQFSQDFPHSDEAMTTDRAMAFEKTGSLAIHAETKGGIDFNSNKMNLQIQNNGGAIKFRLNSAMLQQLQDAPGFVPVIVNIQPMKDLRQFLGLKTQVKVPASV